MRKIFALIALLLLTASCSYAKDQRRFVTFPTLGECKGDSVRLREKPDTSSKISGRINEYDFAVVLKSVKGEGGTWYEIEHPTEKGSAYVSGKYLQPAYREEFQKSPYAKLLMRIFIDYGAEEEKTLAISGEPETTKRIKDDDIIEYVVRNWGDFSVVHLNSKLKSIEVRDGDSKFGNIKIGDSVDKLLKELGEPENKNESEWEYDCLLYGYDIGYVEELVNAYILRFTIDDGEISRMYYYERENGEDGERKFYD